MGSWIASNASSLILYVFLAVLLVLAIRLYGTLMPSREFRSTRFIARVAIFGAMAAILYCVPLFNLSIPLFPSFLSFHFDEVPAFIAGFAYGPLSAFAVLLIKTLIKLPMTSTATAGEWVDLIYSSFFIIPATWIYQKIRNMKGVGWGFLAGLLSQLLISSLLAYPMVLFYAKFYGIPLEGLLAICRAANRNIHDLTGSYILYAILPFNLIKDALVLAITFLVYRSIHVFLRFAPKAKKAR